ncbi:MAG: hypothetical protein JW910_21010 [Anaerolineae bacterium]|nr:hypothetical protein [Anaerolineae bacterium]
MRFRVWAGVLAILVVLTGCAPATPAATPLPATTAVPSETPLSPTDTPAPTSAVLACDAIVQQAITQLDATCAETGRNEACYGHDRVTVALRPGAAGTFDTVGDRIALGALSRLQTSPYDPAGDVWGLALLRVQANLPETLPGQAVTFIAYGDATIEDAGDADSGPMQAVYINTGFGTPTCADAADSGVLVQNDSGAVASLTINGVEIALASTVLVQAAPGAEMVLAVLEGQVDAVALSQRVTAIAGSQLRVALGGANRLEAVQLPVLERLDSTLLQLQNLRELVPVLPERITLPNPLIDLDFDVTPLLPDLTLPDLNLPDLDLPDLDLPDLDLPDLNLPGPGIQITPPRQR